MMINLTGIKDYQTVCYETRSSMFRAEIDQLKQESECSPTPWREEPRSDLEVIAGLPWVVRRMRTATYMIAWNCVDVRVSEITERNVGMVYERMKYAQGIETPGFVTVRGESSEPISEEDLKKHIGLKVKVNEAGSREWLLRANNSDLFRMLHPDESIAGFTWDLYRTFAFLSKTSVTLMDPEVSRELVKIENLLEEMARRARIEASKEAHKPKGAGEV